MAAAAELKDADGSRRQSRRAAVMLLYQEDITGHPMADIVAQHERDAARPLPVYARGLIDGVHEQQPRAHEEQGGTAPLPLARQQQQERHHEVGHQQQQALVRLMEQLQQASARLEAVLG